jgi:hypothetical protein
VLLFDGAAIAMSRPAWLWQSYCLRRIASDSSLAALLADSSLVEEKRF